MDIKSFTSAVIEITEERGLPKEKVIGVIEEAIAAAYKKEYGQKKQKFVAELDIKTGKVNFWQVMFVVTEDMILSEDEITKMKDKPSKDITSEEKIRFNSERHIVLEEAKEIDKNAKPGEEIKIPVQAKEDFGRIAAQTAKQVILQKIKEVEKDEIVKEYKEKEGEVVSGIVQRIEPSAVFFDVGRTSGILPKTEQIPGEFYKIGQRLKLFALKIETSSRGPLLLLSRSYPKMVSKLFELEVPEISSGQVEIKSIAREPGSRSKIAVFATEEGIDPIGSMVGQKGTRIWAVVNELGGEKIDVIEWNELEEKYIANYLSPAKVLEVKILPKNKAQAIVQDDQLSLAIGKNGQNVRLGAKLTGWKIDVRSASQVETEHEDKKKAPVKDEDKKDEVVEKKPSYAKAMAGKEKPKKKATKPKTKKERK